MLKSKKKVIPICTKNKKKMMLYYIAERVSSLFEFNKKNVNMYEIIIIIIITMIM